VRLVYILLLMAACVACPAVAARQRSVIGFRAAVVVGAERPPSALRGGDAPTAHQPSGK